MTESIYLADDLLRGVKEIGECMGKEPRQTAHLLQNNLIPAFKLGGVWHARRSTIRAWIEDLERQAMAGGAPPVSGDPLALGLEPDGRFSIDRDPREMTRDELEALRERGRKLAAKAAFSPEPPGISLASGDAEAPAATGGPA